MRDVLQKDKPAMKDGVCKSAKSDLKAAPINNGL